MLLGGLRRCEVLGLRLEDLRLGEWRVFIAEPFSLACSMRSAESRSLRASHSRTVRQRFLKRRQFVDLLNEPQEGEWA
jgi:integrase